MPDFARAQLRRQRINFALFLGPALVLLAVFFVAPVIIDLVLAFTDMGRTLAVGKFTLENFERMVTRDTRLFGALGVTFIFVADDAWDLQRHLRAAAGAGHHRRARRGSARSFAPCGCCRG